MEYAHRVRRLTTAAPGRGRAVPRIHPNARTTPVTRAEIARKWRERGAADCLDRSAWGKVAARPGLPA